MNEIRAVIYGVGAIGQGTARLMLERGIRITGAIGNRSNIGRDLGELIGLPQPLGVRIANDADTVLREARADIAILSVGDTMEQALPHIERCVCHRVNVLSLSEQVFYPWRCSPELAASVDQLARRHDVTVGAGGIQDVFWINLVTPLSAASQSITSIEGTTLANADDYGPTLAEYHCIGKPIAQFRALSAADASRANVFTIALEALAADLGLTVTGWTQAMRPMPCERPLPAKVLGRTIEPGEVMGAITASRVATHEGIELAGEIHLKVFSGTDRVSSRWRIKGEPELQLECADLPGRIAVSTTIINRIPDIIAAEPGLVTVERLPKPKFRFRLS